ncbi:hypothetical protein Goklo_008280, partial [Gossypium klotzschianum]|nr:hypothetical protein [Gossypium klotzschianum]
VSHAIENEKEVHKTTKIYNTDQAVCGRIAGVITKRYGDIGFAGQINIRFISDVGKLFACFLIP